MDLLEQLLEPRLACSPWHVMSFSGEFVQIVRLNGDEPIAQFSNPFDGIDAGSDPIPCVGTGADSLAAALTDLQDSLGPLIHGRLFRTMIVDTELDVVFVAKPLDHVE